MDQFLYQPFFFFFCFLRRFTTKGNMVSWFGVPDPESVFSTIQSCLKRGLTKLEVLAGALLSLEKKALG